MRVPCARTHGLGGKDTLLHDITFHQMTSLVPSIRQHKMYFEMNVHLAMDPLALAAWFEVKKNWVVKETASCQASSGNDVQDDL